MRILLLDIETAPNTVHVWGLREQDISLNQIIESSYVLCWAAKWLGEKGVMFERTTDPLKGSSHRMICKIHGLLDQADSVITYNGVKFDLPTLNKEFILHGLHQPAPAKQMDLLRVARQQFRFTSNKLDYVAEALGVGKKTRHEGHTLWVKCMNGDKRAWATMERYNKNDVVILEKVYHKLLPWMKQHANQCVRRDSGLVCPNCGGDKYHQRGFAYSQVAKYARFQCLTCYTWFRTTTNEHERGRIKYVSV